MNPSHTITSTTPEKRSPPSTLPTKCTGLFLRRVYTSRVNSLPLISSSPTDSKPDTRPPITKRGAVIHFAHDRKLHQMLGLGIDVGADIKQDRDAAFGVRKWRGQSHAIHRFQRAQQKSATVMTAPVFPALTRPSALASRTRRDGHVHGAVFLSAKRLRGMIVHGDHFAGGHYLNRQVGSRMLGQFGCAGQFA